MSALLPTGLASLLALSACGAGAGPEPPPEYPPMDEPEAVVDESPAPAPEEPAEPAPPPVQVVAAERTPIDGGPPSIRITSPRDRQMVRHGNVMLRIRLRGWELAPAPGKHVHVIVDNEPYMAVRDVRRRIDLNELVQQNTDHELTPGTHVVRVFPSRSDHESVKVGAPFAMVIFHYREETAGFALDAAAPMLTYSRPKGCVTQGERTLLDFYLDHVDGLSEDGFRVRYTISGPDEDDAPVSGDILAWAPHYIENLPLGETRVRLQLWGPEGAVAGPFNDTVRTIRVAQVCDSPAPPRAGPAPGGSAR